MSDHLDNTPPPPPSGLSDDALALWTGWHADLAEGLEADAREVAVLSEAVRHLTLCGRLEAALSQVADIVVAGSRNNDRVHPLVGEIDRARKTVMVLLKSIAPPPDYSALARANGGKRWGK